MILALSPHLDDVVFSCGGYLYDRVRRDGARVHCITVFTASVDRPTGFALACQTDKGLDATVDYMALRRAEDAAACARLGATHEHWAYREAPHRGYASAPALFSGVQASDDLDTDRLTSDLRRALDSARPAEVLYPVGAGDHVDHRQLIAAVDTIRAAYPTVRFRRYYDMPYAQKFRTRYPELGKRVRPYELGEAAVARKVAACADYASQVGFQFGGAGQIAAVLGAEEFLVDADPPAG